MPALTLRRSGGSTNGKRAMSPSPSEVIWRMTVARLVRRISGSVNSGRASKSSSRVEPDRRCRPRRGRSARTRWLAEAWLIGSIGSRCTLVRARVAGDPRDAGVDDVPDAGHGQRRLGDVGGEHDAAHGRGVAGEDLVLLGRARAGSRAAGSRGGQLREARRTRRRCRGSRARPAGRRARRPVPRPTARGPRRRSPRSGRAGPGRRPRRPPAAPAAGGSGPRRGTCGPTPR